MTQQNHLRRFFLFAILFFIVFVSLPTRCLAKRTVMSLDGEWQVEQGGMDAIPEQFTHRVVVPGLIDMAEPAFEQVGVKSNLREAFWYRKQFQIDGPVPSVALLVIHKAKYGMKIYFNGQPVAEHLPCVTPLRLDVTPFLPEKTRIGIGNRPGRAHVPLRPARRGEKISADRKMEPSRRIARSQPSGCGDYRLGHSGLTVSTIGAFRAGDFLEAIASFLVRN